MGRRTVIEVPGVHHHAPIPMAAMVGNILYSSAIMGMDPATGEVPPHEGRQVELVFQHVRTVLEQAGLGPSDVVYCGVLVVHDEVKEPVNRSWEEMFPNANDRPARHTTVMPLPSGLAVQMQIVAVAP